MKMDVTAIQLTIESYEDLKLLQELYETLGSDSFLLDQQFDRFTFEIGPHDAIIEFFQKFNLCDSQIDMDQFKENLCLVKLMKT